MRSITTGLDMTRGPLARNLLVVAGPSMLSYLVQGLYSLIDALWLGRLGAAALVAPTVTFHIIFVAMALALGLGMAGSTMVSQLRGAGRTREMTRAGGQALGLVVLSGLALTVVGLLLSSPILRLMQTPPDAMEGTLAYLRWTLLGMPFVFAFFVFQGIYTGLGDTVRPLQANLLGAGLNVILDPLLIFGWGPFPAMGVAGAALATFVAQSASGGLGVYRLIHGYRDFRLALSDLRWDHRLAARILRVGLPLSLGHAGTALGFALLLGVVNTLGSAVTAALGIGSRIIHLATVPVIGLNQANAAAVGQCLGADRTKRAVAYVRTAAILIVLILLPLTTLMFFFGAPISRVFVDDPEVVQYGRDHFHINSFSVFTFGLFWVIFGSFQGSGHTVPIMILNMTRLWVFRIPAAYGLAIGLGMGPTGIWWAMFISNMLTAAAAAVWFSRGSWKRRVIDSLD